MAEKVSRDRGYRSDTIAISRDMGPLSLEDFRYLWSEWKKKLLLNCDGEYEDSEGSKEETHCTQ